MVPRTANDSKHAVRLQYSDVMRVSASSCGSRCRVVFVRVVGSFASMFFGGGGFPGIHEGKNLVAPRGNHHFDVAV